MKTNQSHRRGFTLVELLVVIVIIASLAGLTAPMVIRQRKKADQTEATSNARQIGLAMFEFEVEYGSFPDASTATMITEAELGQNLTLGTTSSNDYFRQLFAAEITQSEQMFFAKTSYTRKPDGNITGAECLKAGEVGFAYIMNGNSGLSTAGNPARPYVAAPILQSGTDTFDPDPFDSRAVVLRIDNSVSALQIRRQDNLVTLAGSKRLLDTGNDTVWGTEITPTLVKPQPRL